ncbi:hypothetical protein PoB_005009100 [Plakobranchus ocellatus]|uniref:Uncharacterized protein n=1 Tax=Plakobranchus ocellatus TaxID=259542 RepID=A0AAV4BSZ5_9GAST|nr:hypothetical protein PoB_005009100 [Plakobranchus ocellatus]
MSVFPISMKSTRQVSFYTVCRGVTLDKSFVQERNTRSSWRTERYTVGPQVLRRLCGYREETVLHLLSECREVVDDRPKE